MQIEPLEDRVLLSVVNWSGHGDAVSWADPQNWGGHVPGPNDVAIINQSGITVKYNGSSPIQAITSAAALDITGGSFTVTSGGSTVSGSVTVEAVRSLTAVGANTTFTATGTTTINGANLFAESGRTSVPSKGHRLQPGAHQQWTGTHLASRGRGKFARLERPDEHHQRHRL